MAKLSNLILFVPLMILASCTAAQQSSCSSYKFSDQRTRFSSCNELSSLNFSLHWNFHQTSNQVDLAIRHMGMANVPRWIAWAINPTSTGMIGSQSIIAFPRSDGTLAAYTSPVSSYGTQLEPANLTFPVSDISATFNNGEMIIFATLHLLTNSTTVNHVWQEGPLSGDIPMVHNLDGSNLKSFGSLDFLSGKITVAKGGPSSTTTLKYVHGAVNTLSWGILMPTGAIIARYMKVFKSADPLWFYLHVGCQVVAFALGGISGFATGLILGHRSTGIQYTLHRNIGIALFCMATAQVFVGSIRPHKDSKYRPFFNWFHYLVGYSTITMGICNIFKGFSMLQEASVWKFVYIGIIAALGFSALLLEGYTWYLVLANKNNGADEEEKNKQPAQEA